MAIRVEGQKEVIKELQNLQDGLLDDKLRAAIEKGAELVRDEAKARAPERTGRLKASIKAKMARSKKPRGEVYCDYPNTGRVRKTKTKKQAAGSKEYYAFAVEFGTKNMKEQPFLIPAADAKAMDIDRLLENAMREAVPNDRPAAL